jgi:integrase
MGAKVRWVRHRQEWFLYVYANGTEKAKRLGPTDADRRRGERLVREVNRKQVRGELGLEKRKVKPAPFDEFAQRWLRVKVFLPMERGLDGHLSPKTAALREQMVRLHLVDFLGSRDLKGFSVDTIDKLWVHLLEKDRRTPRRDASKRRLTKRTMEIAIGTLRMILADAVAKGIVPANVVDHWKAVQPKGRGSSNLKPIEETKVLTSDEREHFLETAERLAPHHFPFILFMAETGCRISEAIALRWSDVDLDVGIARLYRKKMGGTPDDVELSLRLRTVLRKIQPDIGSHMSTSAAGSSTPS